MNPMKFLCQGISCSTRSISVRTTNFFNRLPYYLLKYPIFEQQRDSHLQERFDVDNANYQRDIQAIQDYTKEIAKRDWNVQEESSSGNKNNSYLQRELSFENRHHALIFMNIVKEKCDEIDHHPEWNLTNDNILKIRLTSHYLNNNLSPKDWELAAFITMKYNEKSDYSFKYNKTTQRLATYSFSGVVALLSFALFYYTYNNFARRNTSPSDFYLAKINHTDDEYQKRNYLR